MACGWDVIAAYCYVSDGRFGSPATRQRDGYHCNKCGLIYKFPPPSEIGYRTRTCTSKGGLPEDLARKGGTNRRPRGPRPKVAPVAARPPLYSKPPLYSCPFSQSWAGRCERPSKPGSDYCSEHSRSKCNRCGKQAVGECGSVIGPMVCGAPLCGKCTCGCGGRV